jgi:hypothetical protein
MNREVEEEKSGKRRLNKNFFDFSGLAVKMILYALALASLSIAHFFARLHGRPTPPREKKRGFPGLSYRSGHDRPASRPLQSRLQGADTGACPPASPA